MSYDETKGFVVKGLGEIELTVFKSFGFDVKSGRLGIQKVLKYKDIAIEVPHGAKFYVVEVGIDLDNVLVFIEEK